MFQKLARATVVCASLVLVISRMMPSVHASPAAPSKDPCRGSQAVFIASQLQARRS